MFAHSLEEQASILSTTATAASATSHLDNALMSQLDHSLRSIHGDVSTHRALFTSTDQPLSQEIEQQEMEQLENQSSHWNDHLLAQAIQSEERKSLEEQRVKEEEEFKKLQVEVKYL